MVRFFLLRFLMCSAITIGQVKPWVKTSLAPGSGVVTKYLLQRYYIFYWISYGDSPLLGFDTFAISTNFSLLLVAVCKST